MNAVRTIGATCIAVPWVFRPPARGVTAVSTERDQHELRSGDGSGALCHRALPVSAYENASQVRHGANTSSASVIELTFPEWPHVYERWHFA